MRTPSELYQPSTHKYAGQRPEIVYPENYVTRLVSKKGMVHLNKRGAFLSESLSGWPVGLEFLNNNVLYIWFTDICLGHTNHRFTKPLNHNHDNTGRWQP